jgi:hypothetical protein
MLLFRELRVRLPTSESDLHLSLAIHVLPHGQPCSSDHEISLAEFGTL